MYVCTCTHRLRKTNISEAQPNRSSFDPSFMQDSYVSVWSVSRVVDFFLPALYWLVYVSNIPLALGIQEAHSMNSCGFFFFFSLVTERLTTAKKKKNELEREIPWNCQSPVKEKLPQILELLATLLIILKEKKSIFSFGIFLLEEEICRTIQY